MSDPAMDDAAPLAVKRLAPAKAPAREAVSTRGAPRAVCGCVGGYVGGGAEYEERMQRMKISSCADRACNRKKTSAAEVALLPFGLE